MFSEAFPSILRKCMLDSWRRIVDSEEASEHIVMNRASATSVQKQLCAIIWEINGHQIMHHFTCAPRPQVRKSKNRCCVKDGINNCKDMYNVRALNNRQHTP